MMTFKRIFWICAVYAVVIGVFDMLCFWLVDEYSTSFYISVIWGNASIVVYAFSTFLMAKKGRYIYLSLQDGFIIGSYTIICVVLNLIFALARMDNVQANIIVNVILLAVYLVLLFTVFANTAAITTQLKYDRKERNAYYDLKDKAERLLGKGDTIQLNKRIETMYDKICSCQINRFVDVSNIDSQIVVLLSKLENDLANGENQDDISLDINSIISLVEERNKQIINSLKR
jgi:hypothetical protein